jgi:hypothetical protein
LDAYNVESFIRDFDDAVSALTITLPGGDITMVDPPPSQAPNSDGSLPTIELDVSNNVDVFGRSAPGWARYTVNVDDASNPVTSRTAIAKYSTFAFNTPSLSEGRFFDLTASGWQLAYAWMGQDVTVPDLDSTITPPTAVDWEVYMNRLQYPDDYLFDANGNLLGIEPYYLAHGSSVSAGGWNVAISSTGGIVLSAGGTLSPGPFLIGVLAINQSDPDDIDATRIMVSAGLLGMATPGGHSAATHANSETLDGLSTGPVTIQDLSTSPPTGDQRIPIRDGSHWAAVWFTQDLVNDQAALDVVDITGVDAPPAGAPGPNIADGNALRVTLDPAGLPDAVRLYSRAIPDIQPGEVYTFAANVATDIANATHSPSMLMAITSGLGAKNSGVLLEHIQFGPADPEWPFTQGTITDAYQKDIFPDATEGWQTLSVNYTAPLTHTYLDVNADNAFDQADLDIIADIFGNPTSPAYEGFTDERDVAKAALKIYGHDGMSSTVHVWLDNLRVYRSAYELDLGLEQTVYSAPVDYTGILPSAAAGPQPTGNMDGTFEGTTDLDALGFVEANGSGLLPASFRAPYGSFAADATYGNATPGSFSVISGPDHTKSGGSSQCLRLQLTGSTSGSDVSIRAFLNSAIVLLPSSGIYCMEGYISMAGGQNEVSTNRAPEYTLALVQMAPNPLGVNYGLVYVNGGTPSSIAAEGWDRFVGTGYIPDTQSIPGKEAVMARVSLLAHTPYGDPAGNFTTAQAYLDDLRIVQVDDPAKFFDADLFDNP